MFAILYYIGGFMKIIGKLLIVIAVALISLGYTHNSTIGLVTEQSYEERLFIFN